jgi:hypothetical protein
MEKQERAQLSTVWTWLGLAAVTLAVGFAAGRLHAPERALPRQAATQSARTTEAEAVIHREPQDAFATASELVDQALVNGAWHNEDRLQMKRLMGRLTPDQAEALMKKLVPRINDRSIAVRTSGPPL